MNKLSTRKDFPNPKNNKSSHLCLANLPWILFVALCLAITLSQPAEAVQFTHGTYTGNGAVTQAITGIGFQPDAVIIKAATAQNGVMRTTTMAGDATKQLTAANALQTARIKSLDANGFSVGNNAEVNGNGTTYYWMAFKDSGAGDFKVGTYTGNGVDNRSIAGVGFQSDYVIVMSAGAVNAVQRSSAMVGDKSFQFDGTASATNLIQALQADGFQVGNDTQVNGNGPVYHYAAWKAVAGTTSVGSYTGNGVDNRSIAGIGFQPNYLIIKANSTAVGVHRPASFVGDSTLRFTNTASFANSIQAIQPDGFQVGTDTTVNTNGTIYYWVAFDATHNATKLAITSVYNPAVGVGFSVTVQAQKPDGTPANVVDATGVSLSLKTGAGTLAGTLTGTIAPGTNQVTISGVTYSQQESGVVLTATRTSGDVLTSADSSPFTVLPQPTLSVSPSSVGRGSNVTVTWTGIPSPSATDWIGYFAFGDANTDPPYFRKYINCSDTPTVSFASGSCVFAMSGVTGDNHFRLLANDGFFDLATSNTLTVNPPSILAVTSINGGANPVAGSPFSVTVQAQDANGSPATVDTDTNVSLSLNNGTGVLGGTLTGTIFQWTNQVTISGITYSKPESGVVLTATPTAGTGIDPVNTAPFTVTSGTPVSLAFTNQPGNITAGSAIPGPPTVAVRDSGGNIVTSSTAAITVAIGN
jgi:hypothetical protein